MPNPSIPSEPPPSYNDATASSSSRPQQSGHSGNHLDVPGHNSMPSSHRRSIEDEGRPLPKGWVRTFDPETTHHFYVDTTKDPPRSVWVHPYDDDEYLSTLSSAERERIEHDSLGRGHPPSKEDIMAAHTDDDDEEEFPSSSSAQASSSGQLPPRPDKVKGKSSTSFGRKFKDKLTGSTHEEREAERKRRAEREAELYKQHLLVRKAMAEAQRTGQPQLIGKDKSGKDIYVEPPSYSGGMYGGGGYGYNPYGSSGIYSTPNARYVRPSAPYSRPMGYGYGGGYGLPLGMGLGGGLLGGMMLGDMMGGGMGMGMGGMGGMGM